MADRKVWEFNDFTGINRGLANWRAVNGYALGVNPQTALAQSGLPTGISTERTPEGQQKPTQQTKDQALAVLNDPKQLQAIADKELADQDQSFVDRSKTMLARVFDYEDEADLKVGPVNLSGVESVWDGMLRAFDWGYDRLNQVTAAGISGLPGGIETLTWEEAGNVSVGQAFLGSMGAAAGRAERGEGTVGDILMAPFTGLSTILAQLDTDSILQDKNFDITNEEQRKQAFQDEAAAMWTSGLLDASFAIFGDPLIVGGKFAKITRLKYIDRPLTPKNRAQFVDEINTDVIKIASGDTGKLSPVGQWIKDAVTPDANGNLPSGYKVIERAEIKDSSDAAGIASAVDTINQIEPDVGRRAKLLGLTLRVAASDEKALEALYRSSANVSEEIVKKQHELYMADLAVNPSAHAKILATSQSSFNRASNYRDAIVTRIKQGENLDTELARADRALSDAKRLLDDVQNYRVPDPLAVPEAAGSKAALDQQRILKDQVRELEARNEFFQSAVKEARIGSLQEGDRMFASNTVLGRAASARRARRAERAYEIKATSGSSWRHKDFLGNGLGTKIFRVWSYMGLENPTAYMVTKGTGGMFAWKNVQAFLDKLEMYSGAPTVINGTAVGGLSRKEELFGAFIKEMDNTQDASLALNVIEDMVKADMASFYGMNNDLMDAIVNKSRATYTDYDQFIRQTNGLFPDGIDGAEELTRVLNVAPNLPAQLAEGRYILPFEEIEKIIKNGKAGKIKGFDDGNIIRPFDSASQRMTQALDVFNDIWRPMILFRLGYTQRNVAEGIFRSMAFNSSLAPIQWAGAAGLNGFRNFRRAKRAAKDAAVVNAKLMQPDQARDKFDEASNILMAEQRELRLDSNRISNYRKMVADGAKVTDKKLNKKFSTTDEIDAFVVQQEARISQINQELMAMPPRPVSSALKNSKFEKWRKSNLEELETQYQAGVDYEQNVLGLIQDFKLDMDPVIETNLRALRTQNEEVMRSMLLLERDDVYALSRWQSQASRKVRPQSKASAPIQGRPDLLIQGAFGGEYGQIAANLASADNTIRSTLALRLQTMQHVLLKQNFKNWVNVEPGQGQAYWQGMADMLRQYSSSTIGKKLLGNDSDEDIAIWLLSQEGRQTRDQINAAWQFGLEQKAAKNPDVKVAFTERIADQDSAIQYVKELRQGLGIITANSLEARLLALDHAPSADELKRILDGNPNLQPVIGHKDSLTGELNGTMDIIRGYTAKMFEYIGTMPEDAFVRLPFYADRYKKTVAVAVDNLLDQYKDVNLIPARRIAEIQTQASRRALKDTKDWLYTIDRRTNLGRYGELLSPFVSAQQNSINAIGKLTRRDPSLPGIMLLLWNAPNRVGWEDEDGNIVIPLPMDLVPQGARDAVKTISGGRFDIPSTSELKIPKDGLNSIFPESGFAFVPRPNALVQVGASELMKRSLFIGPEAPDILVNFLGPEDADTLWTYGKNYIFGEEGTVSTQPVSYDKILAPWMQKAIQMWQNDSSAQYSYQYGLQARQADLEFQAGLRDEYPKPEEIQAKTNGLFLLRMLGNLVGYTSPRYDTAVSKLVDIQNKYDQIYGLEGPMKFSQTFGNEVMLLAQIKSTQSVGGALPTADVVRNIKKYDSLLREVSPELENIDVLGILVNGDASNSEYDPNSYSWMQQATIPGTSRQWRETLSGAEAMAEAQRQAGWVEYIKFMGQLDTLLYQRGLPSYRVKAAQDLNSMKAQFVQNMKDNPMYEAWVSDYESRGSSKTYESVKVIQAALDDEGFMQDNGQSRTWQIANLYMQARQRVMDIVAASGSGIDAEVNVQVKYEWDTLRQQFINDDIGWAAIANRYLRNDDDPTMIGASFGGSNG